MTKKHCSKAFPPTGLGKGLNDLSQYIVFLTGKLCLPHRMAGKIKLDAHAKHLKCLAQNECWLGKY